MLNRITELFGEWASELGIKITQISEDTVIASLDKFTICFKFSQEGYEFATPLLTIPQKELRDAPIVLDLLLEQETAGVVQQIDELNVIIAKRQRMILIGLSDTELKSGWLEDISLITRLQKQISNYLIKERGVFASELVLPITSTSEIIRILNVEAANLDDISEKDTKLLKSGAQQGIVSSRWYDEIVALDNLRKAWIKAHHYARTEEIFFDYYGYEVFSSHLEVNLRMLRQELIDNTYQPSPLQFVSIPKGEKRRKVYFAAPRDTIVLQAIMNIIGPYFESQFSDSSFGNRLNIADKESQNPYQRWQERYSEYVTTVRQFLNKGQGAWYLITDIEDFYPSINRARLRGILARYLPDEQVLLLLSKFLELNAINSDNEIESIPGLPPGAIHAHFLANIYLMMFDKLANENSLGYARYVDDICLVFNTKDSLDQTERLLQQHLLQWGHRFKPSKSERWPVTEWQTLIEHTRKMKYVTRLDFGALLDLEDDDFDIVRDAEYYFRRLYRIVDLDGDTERLVKEAASTILQLHKLGVTGIDEIIYSLLDTSPLKPGTLRVILSVLLDIELPILSERFQKLFSQTLNDEGYLRINLLQLIPYFTEWGTNLKDFLLSDFAGDPNYLVRANTYVALKQLAEMGIIHLDTSELYNLRQREISRFALLRLVDCYSTISSEEVWASLITAVTPQMPMVNKAVAYTFHKLLDQGDISSSMIDTILPVFDEPAE